MTNNPNFPNPKPTLPELNAAIDELEQTYRNGLTGNRIMKRQQVQNLKNLIRLMGLLKAYVQNESGDDLEKALSSGMALKKAGIRISQIERVTNLRAKMMRTRGEVKLMWNPVPHRKIYLVYAVPEKEDIMDRSKWTMLGCSVFPRYLARGLESAKGHAFFIVPVGLCCWRSK
jgi:hypothetical protein